MHQPYDAVLRLSVVCAVSHTAQMTVFGTPATGLVPEDHLKCDKCRACCTAPSSLACRSGARTRRPAVPKRNSGVAGHCLWGTTASAQASSGCKAVIHRPGRQAVSCTTTRSGLTAISHMETSQALCYSEAVELQPSALPASLLTAHKVSVGLWRVSPRQMSPHA